jgi:hypothetical protein
MSGAPIRQEYFETVISWINDGEIEQYMALHQFDENAEQLSTFHFRYIGEKQGAEEEIRRMSESLIEPLELLRRQYHKLER